MCRDLAGSSTQLQREVPFGTKVHSLHSSVCMDYTPNQLLAINTLDTNLQIIACAGSGKTQVIAERIINLLKKKELPPANITAFTYTEKAAGELKARVLRLCREELGNVLGLAEMYVGTIHGWCLN